MAPGIAAGPESRDVALFTWDRNPWDELACPGVRRKHAYFAQTRGLTVFAPQRGPSGEHAYR